MKAVTNSSFAKSPVLHFQKKVGSTFVGTLKNKKQGKLEGSQIYEFAIEDGDVSVEIATDQKDEKGNSVYAECNVEPGAIVSLFGNTQLNDKIGLQTQVGERVVIVYKGLAVNPKSKRKFNDYFVGKLEVGEAVDLEAVKKA